MLFEWKPSLRSRSQEFEVRSPGVIQLLIELKFLSDFVKEETANFQPGLTMKFFILNYGIKNDLILIMTPEKRDKILELSKHWSADSTPTRNEVIMKTTYPAKSVKCDKICSNY